MTKIDITPLSRHRSKNGRQKPFTAGDIQYLDWIKERDRAAKAASPKISTNKRRAIIAKLNADRRFQQPKDFSETRGV